MTNYFGTIKDGAGHLMFGRGSDPSGQYAVQVSGSQTAGDRWCVAVIDESDNAGTATTIAARYATFRATWPNRKLFLLIPSSTTLTSVPVVTPPGVEYTGSSGYVFVPQQAITDSASSLFQGPTKVNRDGGVVGNLSDWFALTGMGVLSAGAKVGLFVDNSGSMFTSTVQASYNKFIADVAAAGLSIITVTDPNEDWISPFTSMSGT
jgi:hypothetical protein